jgi:hypothetical protein
MNNVTRIEDLPELSSIENNERAEHHDKINKKFIRASQELHGDSGMTMSNSTAGMVNQNRNYQSEYDVPYYNQALQDYPSPVSQISCINVSDHVKNCNVCGRLYRSDNVGYIIAIILLVLVCLLLLRKIDLL